MAKKLTKDDPNWIHYARGGFSIEEEDNYTTCKLRVPEFAKKPKKGDANQFVGINTGDVTCPYCLLNIIQSATRELESVKECLVKILGVEKR